MIADGGELLIGCRCPVVDASHFMGKLIKIVKKVPFLYLDHFLHTSGSLVKLGPYFVRAGDYTPQLVGLKNTIYNILVLLDTAIDKRC